MADNSERSSSKRVVIVRSDGVAEIKGVVTCQPPDLLAFDGVQYNLIGLRRYKYYVYKPVMSPSEVMQTFHESQR